MATFQPEFSVFVAPIPAANGYLKQPPICWNVLAEDINSEHDTTVDGARFLDNRKELIGQHTPKIQDTYLVGTGSRTGRSFNAITGDWHDDAVSPVYGAYYLLMQDGSDGTSYEVVSDDSNDTDTIESAEIVLHIGMPAPGSGHTASDNYCYLHLAYKGSNPIGCDYRLAFVYGQSIALEFTSDGGNTWKRVHQCRNLGSVERYLQANDYTIRLNVQPRLDEGILDIEVGEGNWMTHCPKNTILALGQTQTEAFLPSPGKIRLIGQNAWVGLEYYPNRHDDITISKSPRPYGEDIPNIGNAFLVVNGAGGSAAGQFVSASTNWDGQNLSWDATISAPDAGDGLGSAEAPRLVNATLIVPPVWTDSVDGLPDLNAAIQYLRGMRVDELCVWDDATRTLSCSASVACNNFDSLYTAAFGNMALGIDATNGITPLLPRIRGIAGYGDQGIHFYRHDPTRLMLLPVADYSVKMQVPLEDEIVLDRWALPAAVNFLCQKGNIHPRYLQTIPEWDWGPADSNCPYPILGSGIGARPNYKFGPELTPWAILQMIVQDTGQVNHWTGQSIPYYMGWDMRDIVTYGFPQFRFEAFDPAGLTPVGLFSDFDTTGQGYIEEIEVYNSVSQMRSHVVFQGLDAFTNELLQAYIPLPDSVKQAIGYRYGWVERNARYTDDVGIQNIALAAAQMASIPQQVVRMKVPFQPTVFPGSLIWISEQNALGRTGLFYIIEMRSSYGMQDLRGLSGFRDCYSWITARAVEDTPHS